MIWNAADVLISAMTVIVEARAALAAAQRYGRLTAPQLRSAKTELADLLEEVAFVEITDALVGEAADLAEAEALRGYDAIHLASALAVGANIFTSSDVALCSAAERRGIYVANPLDS